MNEKSMSMALQAIYEEAERLKRLASSEVADGLDLIMSMARHGADVRGHSAYAHLGEKK